MKKNPKKIFVFEKIEIYWTLGCEMKCTCDQIGLALVGVGRGAGAKVMLPVAAKVHYSLR